MISSAILSSCGTYRYQLSRQLRPCGGQPVIFVMLNPSTADATQDDPTIRRCMGFASSWGATDLDVINLFAFRATKPKDLLTLSQEQAVGPRNLEAWEAVIINARRFGEPRVIAAWGALDKRLQYQAETALGWLDKWNVGVDCLGTTKQGHPRHPLYLPKTAERVPYERSPS